MKKIILPLCLLITGCGHTVTTFTPIDLAPIGNHITATQKTIHEAQIQAALIARTGTQAGSSEATQLVGTITRAETDAGAAQKALADYKRDNDKTYLVINQTVSKQASQISKDRVEMQAFQHRLLIRGILAVLCLFLGALIFEFAPYSKPILGGWALLIPGFFFSLMAVAAAALLLSSFLTLTTLFGWF